jgi:teichoic acid transport system permease protein
MSTTRVEAAPAAPTAGLLDGIPPEDLRRLRPVGARPPLARYIADVWGHRSFIWALAVSGLRSNNGRDKLGNFWLVLSPVVNGLIYFLVFGVLLGTGKNVPNFIGYLVIGVFMFTYSNRAISTGAKAITGNRKLIQTLRFPRAVLPISEVVEQLLAFGVSFVAMLLLVLVVPPWEGITWRWLLVVPAVALQTVFNGGLVMIFARLTSRISDFTNILPFLLRAWLYMSGVFYTVERFAHHPTLKRVFELNPAHAFLTIARELILYHQVPGLGVWLVAIGWTVPMAIVGFVLFWRAEESYARD